MLPSRSDRRSTIHSTAAQRNGFGISERQSGMFGLLHALASVATLLLMCDRRDLGTAIGERPPAPDAQDTGMDANQL